MVLFLCGGQLRSYDSEVCAEDEVTFPFLFIFYLFVRIC